MLVENFPVALGVCVGVAAAVAAAFVLSMPMLHPPIDRAMLASGESPHLSVRDVRNAFAARGLPLVGAAPDTSGVTLTDAAAGVTVFVSRGDGRAAGERGDRRVGNVLVHDGGSDPGVRAQVAAAVAELRGR